MNWRDKMLKGLIYRLPLEAFHPLRYRSEYATEIEMELERQQSTLSHSHFNHIVLVASCLNPPDSPLACTPVRSVFSSDERLQQTSEGLKTVKLVLQECAILFVDNSEVLSYQKEQLLSYVNCYLNISSTSWIRGTQKHGNKGVPYWALVLAGLLGLRNITWDFLHIICGRYGFNENFDISRHQTGKYNFRFYAKHKIVSTRYYSIGKMGWNDVYQDHVYCYNKALLGLGSEPTIYWKTRGRQVLMDQIGVRGFMGGGNYISE